MTSVSSQISPPKPTHQHQKPADMPPLTPRVRPPLLRSLTLDMFSSSPALVSIPLTQAAMPFTPATVNPFDSPTDRSPDSDHPTPNQDADMFDSQERLAVVYERAVDVRDRDTKFWIAIVVIELSLISFAGAVAIMFREQSDGGISSGTAVWAYVSVMVCLLGFVVCFVRIRRWKNRKRGVDQTRDSGRRGNRDGIDEERSGQTVRNTQQTEQRDNGNDNDSTQRSEDRQRRLDRLEANLHVENHQPRRENTISPEESDLGIYSLNQLASSSVPSYHVSSWSDRSGTTYASSFGSSVNGGEAVTNYSPLDDMVSAERIRGFSPRESRAYFEMRRERQGLQNGVHIPGGSTVRAEPSPRRTVNPLRFELGDHFEMEDMATDEHVRKAGNGGRVLERLARAA